MIHHMRHGAPPRLMAPQPIDGRALRKSHPAPSAGNRITRPGVGPPLALKGQGVRGAAANRNHGLAQRLTLRHAATKSSTLSVARVPLDRSSNDTELCPTATTMT